MRIDSFSITQKPKYNTPGFRGGMPIRSYTLSELMNNDKLVKLFASNEPKMSEEYVKGYCEFMRKIKDNNNREYLASLTPRARAAAKKILSLDYTMDYCESFLYYKPKELEDIYGIVSQRDASGKLRFPGSTMTFMFGIDPERLKILKPIILSKSDMGLWNYRETFIMDLDTLNDRQLEVMSKLTDCNIEPRSLFGIVRNPNLNWDKTVEKAQSMKKRFGNNLREIAFYSNRNGENFLSADIQLPHSDETPDWKNFRRIFALLDNDVNPIARMKSNSNIDNVVENIYAKLEKKLHVFTEKDLNRIIFNIRNEVPGASEQDVLCVLQRLTQWASYSSLPKLSEKLIANNIGEISELGELNPIFKYFNEYKKILPLKDDYSANTAFILDNNDIANNAMRTARGGGGPLWTSFINLEGWNDGVNLISDDRNLEPAAKRVLIKAREILRKSKDCTLDEAIGYVLNHRFKEAAREANVNLKTLRNNAPATKSVILDQMRPYMPTKSLLKSTIESIAKHYSDDSKEFEDLCLRVARYYDENLNVFSKQSIIENLKEINRNIDVFLEKKGLSRENLYFVKSNLPPCMVKSFDLINKMNADLFGISAEKNLRICTFFEANKYPPGSTFVILDDLAGSGASMLEMGEYMFMAKALQKDRHILFCPITATKLGLDNIQNSITTSGRNNSDAIITIAENTKDYSKTSELFVQDSELAQTVFGERGHGNAGMCTAFPYMAPDNNSTLAGYLAKFFLPNDKCIKNKTDLLPVIEEETYYYDIFGTDKEHVLTDAIRVYDPPKPTFITKVIHKMFKRDE